MKAFVFIIGKNMSRNDNTPCVEDRKTPAQNSYLTWSFIIGLGEGAASVTNSAVTTALTNLTTPLFNIAGRVAGGAMRVAVVGSLWGASVLVNGTVNLFSSTAPAKPTTSQSTPQPP